MYVLGMSISQLLLRALDCMHFLNSLDRLLDSGESLRNHLFMTQQTAHNFPLFLRKE